MKVINTYQTVFTVAGDFQCPDDKHVFRLDFIVAGSAGVLLKKSGGALSQSFRCPAIYTLSNLQLSDPPRRDNWEFSFTGAAPQVFVVVMHVVEETKD